LVEALSVKPRDVVGLRHMSCGFRSRPWQVESRTYRVLGATATRGDAEIVFGTTCRQIDGRFTNNQHQGLAGRTCT
jgi:hypothetical protein